MRKKKRYVESQCQRPCQEVLGFHARDNENPLMIFKQENNLYLISEH